MDYPTNNGKPEAVKEFRENYEGSTYIMLKRTKETEEIMKDSACFMLLSQIAIRARRTNIFNKDNLQIGEALIGDYQSIGLTERRYRTAKLKLKKWGFATFKATNKGTVATLINTDIFDINIFQSDEQIDSQETNKRRTRDEQETTNNNDKNVNNEKNDNKRMLSDFQENPPSLAPGEIARKFFKAYLNPELRGEVFKEYADRLGDKLDGFCEYWLEPNKSGKKVRWELEKTWELGKRIGTWLKNDKSFGPKKTAQEIRDEKFLEANRRAMARFREED